MQTEGNRVRKAKETHYEDREQISLKTEGQCEYRGTESEDGD
jgi:hypothetical protein